MTLLQIILWSLVAAAAIGAMIVHYVIDNLRKGRDEVVDAETAFPDGLNPPVAGAWKDRADEAQYAATIEGRLPVDTGREGR